MTVLKPLETRLLKRIIIPAQRGQGFFMRAFVYCRVSTKEQSTEDHYSLGNQLQRCTDHVKSRQWRVVKSRQDVASGKNDEREGFQELRKQIADRKIDVVVVYRLDRLSRNVRDIYDFLDSMKESGIAFVSITEGFDTTTAMGRAMLGVAAVFAQLTREMIAENVKDGLQRRAEAGLFNGNANKIYGYRYSRELGLEPVPSEAAIVKQAFEWRAEHKWGTLKVAQMLNLRGIPSKTGIQWTQAGVGFMLRNRTYCGEVRTKAGWIPGRHAAIIPTELFAAAEALRRSRSAQAPRTQSSPHLLSGIARCGLCGVALYIHSSMSKTKKTPTVSYFHGANPKTGAGACAGMYKNARVLEESVLSQIAAASQSHALNHVVLEDLQQRQDNERTPRLKERDKLLLEQERLGERFSQWADRLDAGKLDEEQFDRQNAKLMEQKKQIQAQLAAIDAEFSQNDDLEISIDAVREALNDFPKVWQELEFEEQREMVRLLIEELKVFKGHVELKLLFMDPVIIPWPARVGRPKSKSVAMPANLGAI